ncbi:MAG TPA: hypothetical protein VGB83_10340 [Actinomycetota bacterium]
MTTIEAICTKCGPVERTAHDFELAVCNHPGASYYAFTCPSCDCRIQKPASDRVVELLIAEGVTPVLWTLPEEMTEEHHGAPFTVDDLLDFHLELERDDWVERLTAA